MGLGLGLGRMFGMLVNVREAKIQPSRLSELLEGGESVVIARQGGAGGGRGAGAEEGRLSFWHRAR